jgi:hypothetical protein
MGQLTRPGSSYWLGVMELLEEPVPLQKCRDRPDLRVHELIHAARWYSLITPLTTFRRSTGRWASIRPPREPIRLREGACIRVLRRDRLGGLIHEYAQVA